MEAGYDRPLVNFGSGQDVTIRELAETVMRVASSTPASRRHCVRVARRKARPCARMDGKDCAGRRHREHLYHCAVS